MKCRVKLTLLLCINGQNVKNVTEKCKEWWKYVVKRWGYGRISFVFLKKDIISKKGGKQI